MPIKSKNVRKNNPREIAFASTQETTEGSVRTIDKSTPIQEKGFAIFAVGNEWYCVDMGSIFEILHDFEITTVTHLPFFFEGVTNLRGESIPVVNLRNLLSLNPGTNDSQVCIIIQKDNVKTGFLIDSEIEIVKSTEMQFFSLPDCYSPEEQKFLEGILEYKNRLIGVLKLNQALEILSERRSRNEDK